MPRSPTRSTSSSPYSRPHPRPMAGQHHHASLSRSVSNASARTTQTLTEDSCSVNSSSSSKSFWSAFLRPKFNFDRSMIPLLKSIPSQSQLVFTTPSDLDSKTKKKVISLPKPARRPSLSSTLESASTPSSSRSGSPVKPGLPAACGTGRRRSYELPRHRHRRYPHSDTISSLPTRTSPSKSILSRTASSSTKASSTNTNNHTNKSVKFATVSTTVHYPSFRGNNSDYYHHLDMDSLDPDNESVDINIDAMDLDDDPDPFANYRSREVSMDDVFDVDEEEQKQGGDQGLGEVRSDTPTPERERERLDKAKRLKEIITFARRSTTVVGSSGGTHPERVRVGHKKASGTTSAPPSPSPRRPVVISSPYVLGAYPSTQAYRTVGAEDSTSSSALLDNNNDNTSSARSPWASAYSFVKKTAGPTATTTNDSASTSNILFSSSSGIKSTPSRSRSRSCSGSYAHNNTNHSSSCESLRSTKTTGAVSLRSLESIGRFRGWVGQRNLEP